MESVFYLPKGKTKRTWGVPIIRLIYPFLFSIYIICLFVLFGLFKLILLLNNLLWEFQNQLYPKSNRKRLAIIGGGYAGTFAAVQLEHEFSTTLIDSKDYFEFTPSKLRTFVEPSKSKVIQVEYSRVLKNTRVVTAFVTHISTDFVTCEDGENIPYDFLLICSGSRYIEPYFPPFEHEFKGMKQSSPTLIASVRSSSFQQYQSLLSESKKIAIIGGGTVGVELGAEIVENFREKEVTIIHSNYRLMHRSPLRAICYAEDYFMRNGVQLVLGQRVVAHKGSFFVTSQGVVIEADLAFMCTGNVPNSDFMRNSCFSDKLNSFGFIKVNEFLQLHGYRNIFVAGDVTDIPEEEEKLCQTAGAEVAVVIKNLRSMLYAKPLHKYVPTKCPMLISLGKYDGVLTYRGFTWTGFLPAIMKEFVEWKEMVYYWDWSRFVGDRQTTVRSNAYYV